jgi:hypothetical protein
MWKGSFAAGVAATCIACGALAQQPVVVQSLTCVGEEPFWRLDANRTTGTYTALAAKGKREVVFRGSLQSLSFPSPPVMVWRGDSTHLPRETLVATLREEACRSTMAEGPPKTHRVMLSLKAGEAVTGCCTVRAAYDARTAPAANFAAKNPDDWARFLPDLLPAMNLCLTRSGGRAKWIARAAPAGRTAASVRVVEADGQALDCTADLTGRGVPTIARVPVTAPTLAGAGNPLFHPARDQTPMVSCGRLERVLGKNNAVQGYLHYDPC